MELAKTNIILFNNNSEPICGQLKNRNTKDYISASGLFPFILQKQLNPICVVLQDL